MNSTSVVTQYAIFREYVAELEPAHLVWFFFEGNDLFDLGFEMRFPQLETYARGGPLQDLAARSEEIGTEMRRYVDEALESQEVSYITHDVRRPFRQRVREFVTLQRTRFQLAKSPLVGSLRKALGLEFAVIGEDAVERADWETVERLWREVASAQLEAGRDITFVYLPDAYRFMGETTGAWRSIEERATEIWKRIGVRHVSVAAHLERTEDPLGLFHGSHFSPEGYRIVAGMVAGCIADEARCAAVDSPAESGR